MQVDVVTVRTVSFEEVAPLFAELDLDLAERYGGGQPVRFSRTEFDPPRGRLLAAEWPDGRLAGCGGVRPLPEADEFGTGLAELKRMFVRPFARRQGVAGALLAACEEAARELGYRALWLETGTRQPDAGRLYRRAGYVDVPRFGQYRDEPDSVYLGRALTD